MMEKIKLKTNRIVFIILLTINILLMTVGISLIIYDIIKNIEVDYFDLILYSVINLISMTILLLVLFYKVKHFHFYEDKIEVYLKDKLIETIVLSEIKIIRYYPFKWHYILTIFFGALNEGGAWKLHMYDYNENKYEVGLISFKDAKRLKQMYPIIELMYTKDYNQNKL